MRAASTALAAASPITMPLAMASGLAGTPEIDVL
jgi:hypothetical protein